MRSALLLARDGPGCLESGHWQGFGYRYKSRAPRHRATAREGAELPKVQNDVGVPEMEVRTREFVCTGQAPPHDHPHVSIRIGVENRATCPYCGTKAIYCSEQG